MNVKFRLITSGEIFRPGSTAKIVEDSAAEALRAGRSYVQGITPVDTGRLKRGWEIKPGLPGEIFNETPYARFVEEGTSRMEGRFMLKRSIPVIEKLFVNFVTQKIKRIGG